MKAIQFVAIVGCIVAVFSIAAFCQLSTESQLRIATLQNTLTQNNDRARSLDQQAANEDQLASSSTGWAKVLHQFAALGYRKQASDARKAANQALSEVERLQSSASSVLPPSPPSVSSTVHTSFSSNASGLISPGVSETAASAHLTGTDDYLQIDDPITLEKKIESYLNKVGVKATWLTGNGGSVHYVSVRYKSQTAAPDFEYRIAAVDPHAGEDGFQLIGITLMTNFRTSSVPGDLLSSALLAAGKTSDCGLFLDGDSIRCRAWLIVPQKTPIPVEVLLDRIRMMNLGWNRLSSAVAAIPK